MARSHSCTRCAACFIEEEGEGLAFFYGAMQLHEVQYVYPTHTFDLGTKRCEEVQHNSQITSDADMFQAGSDCSTEVCIKSIETALVFQCDRDMPGA